MEGEVTAETAEAAETAEFPPQCNQRASSPPGCSFQGAAHTNDPREEATYSDQCTAHSKRSPLQQDQQTRGKEWEVTSESAEAAEAAGHPPQDNHS
eukprot:1689501-Pyramimonas_sp.AAC.1